MPLALDEDVRIAIAKALGEGHTQHAIAKEFGVSRSAVATIQRESKRIAPDWRETHARLYVDAITKKMPKIDDPAKAVNAAQVGLTKLGLLGGDNPGQTKVEVWLGSDAVARIAAKWTTTGSDALPDNGATDAKLLNP